MDEDRKDPRQLKQFFEYPSQVVIKPNNSRKKQG